MKNKLLDQLAQLIEKERDSLLAEWRGKVRELPAAQSLDVPTLNDHIPNLLQELAVALRSGSEITIAQALKEGSSPSHGLQRVQDSYDIDEVVAEYNILRGCIHDLADRNGISMQGKPFHVLNRVLDYAVGMAVESFATQKALEVRQRRDEHLAFIAHDLRTPLNAISLSSRVLEIILANGHIDMPQAKQMLRTLNRNVKYLETLIGEVLEETENLDLEEKLILERRRFDLWPLIESIIQDLHPVAEASSTVLTNSIPEELLIYADADLLRRVFQNLVANAVDYTPGGEVIIGAYENLETGDVECFVHDNGKGIPVGELDRVFEKYETDGQVDGGLGLGLAIVKTFVEAHNGSVTLESTLGSGSKFRFTLPGGPLLAGEAEPD